MIVLRYALQANNKFMMECIASGRLDSEKCHCPICSRSYKKPVSIVEPEKFDDIHEVPFGEGLLVLL